MNALTTNLTDRMTAQTIDLIDRMNAHEHSVDNKVDTAIKHQLRFLIISVCGFFLALLASLITLHTSRLNTIESRINDKFNSYTQQYELNLQDNKNKVYQTPKSTTDDSKSSIIE